MSDDDIARTIREHDIDIADRALEIRGLIIDDLIDAQGADEIRIAARRGRDHARAFPARELSGEDARAARRAVNEHEVMRGQPLDLFARPLVEGVIDADDDVGRRDQMREAVGDHCRDLAERLARDQLAAQFARDRDRDVDSFGLHPLLDAGKA